MKNNWLGAGYATIGALGAAVAFGVHLDANRNTQTAWQHHLEAHQAAASEQALQVGKAIGSIYENLRTLSLLPSVRKIDRHGTMLGDDGRETIQQIYNNLASNVDVSEVYILPVDFDPAALDPVTGKLEEPILMFDQLIVNAGRLSHQADPFAAKATPREENIDEPEEVEIYEYRLLQKQLNWLKHRYSDQNIIVGLSVPMISGGEVITCDNTEYITDRTDASRSGLIFSIPFYGQDRKLKGSISAIILSSALRNLLPSSQYSLSSPHREFATSDAAALRGQQLSESPDVGLVSAGSIFFESIAIATSDPRGTWTLRAEYAAADFFAGTEFHSIVTFERTALGTLALLTLAGLGWLTMLHRWNRQMLHSATHDALTGLPNKALLLERIAESIARSARGEQAGLLYLDLDRFKIVNDTLGHPAGDALLVLVAERMRNCLRRGDTLARIGGDEFVILQRDLERPEDASKLAQRIIESIALPFDVKGQSVSIGTSAGISLIAADGNDADTLLRNADLALFRAKANERGSWRYFEPAMDAQQRERRQLELDLRNAVARDQLVLHYQPFVDLSTEEVIGFEALVRWNHPEKGMVPPLKFIDIAEDIGAIGLIGEWVIRRACLDAMAWPDHIKVAVNISAAQFKNDTLTRIITSALDETGLAPERLELEITESVLLAADGTTMKILTELRALGVNIALDDFGTGYASLSYLRSFSFDKIKVDRSFVSDTGDTGTDMAILTAIGSLGSSLGMTITAEGVETEEQLRKIRAHGYTQVQGYYFSRPVPMASTIALISEPRLALAVA